MQKGSETEQLKMILCRSVGSIPRPMQLAQQGKCSECTVAIWLAPSSINLMATVPDVVTLCDRCDQKRISEAEEPPIYALAPGAAQEVLAELKGVHNN